MERAVPSAMVGVPGKQVNAELFPVVHGLFTGCSIDFMPDLQEIEAMEMQGSGAKPCVLKRRRIC